MASFTLPNTPFPNGTSVSAYDATGYSFFPASGPPGSPVATATVTGGSLTFTGLTNHRSYFAAALVGGQWSNRQFTPGENGPAPRLPDGLDYADIAPGKVVAVNEDESGFVFSDGGGGGSSIPTAAEPLSSPDVDSGSVQLKVGVNVVTLTEDAEAEMPTSDEMPTPEELGLEGIEDLAYSCTIIRSQNGTGGFDFTYPDNCEMQEGLPYLVSQAPSAKDVDTAVTTDYGDTWIIFSGGNDYR